MDREGVHIRRFLYGISIFSRDQRIIGNPKLQLLRQKPDDALVSACDFTFFQYLPNQEHTLKIIIIISGRQPMNLSVDFWT